MELVSVATRSGSALTAAASARSPTLTNTHPSTCPLKMHVIAHGRAQTDNFT
jgi:hypothetical protein